jgi:1-deoxy-D-xylulose 5-phosphate reductoisomerase
MKQKRVVVLGATGSIGESALKVARDIPERMEIVGLAANSNAKKLAQQANATKPGALCLVDESKIDELRTNLNYAPRILAGEQGLREIATLPGSDMVLIAIVGTGGLRPALAAIRREKISRSRARKFLSWPAKRSWARLPKKMCTCFQSIANTMRSFSVSMEGTRKFAELF